MPKRYLLIVENCDISQDGPYGDDEALVIAAQDLATDDGSTMCFRLEIGDDGEPSVSSFTTSEMSWGPDEK